MDGNKELELSLGLACGVTTSASTDRSGNSADDKMDADERTSKILNDFRNFLNAGVPESLQTPDPVKRPENFFNQIHQIPSGEDDSINEIGVSENKRKSSFDDSKNHKKQETESHNSDSHDKEKNSHISITTDEGSTGDNEDVAESEAEGTSRVVPHHDDGSASSSQAHKESSPFPIQTMNTSSVPYSITIKESASTNALSTSIYPSSMHTIPPTNSSHPLPHAASKTVPMTFTHSSFQTPDKSHSWGIARPPAVQSVHSPYTGRPTPTSASMLMTNPTSSEATPTDRRPQQQLRSPPILISEDGSPSQSEGNAAQTGGRPNSFPSEYPAIKPGIAAEVKFGGSGSFPNLPWVSTTGPGPNGKTISGVTYKFNATQIKIVCACHGLHLSPEEFVRHATEDQPSGATTTVLTSLRSGNPATSAKS